MKEMTRNRNFHQGGSVKKTLLVVALATVFVFAVAGSAFAGVNHSGQLRLGAKVPAGESAKVGGVTTPGAGTNTYYDWDQTLLGNAVVPDGGHSPHGNYTTTTVKCVVCHAVHYAAPGGAPVLNAGGTDTQSADTLLRNRADAACIYCHATAGQAVNGTPVYNGDTADLLAGHTGQDYDTGHNIGNGCHYCHSSVHGAYADTSIPAFAGYLLNMPGGTNLNPPSPLTMWVPQVANPGSGDFAPAPAADMAGIIGNLESGATNEGFTDVGQTPLPHSLGDYQNPAISGIPDATTRGQVIGIFCAECHDGAYPTGAAGASTNVALTSGPATMYTGHRIGAAATNDWNNNTDPKSSSAFTGKIAWAAASTCPDCHDAQDSLGNTAFPHAWGQDSAGNSTRMYLLMASEYGATKTTLSNPLPSPLHNSYETSPVQLQDGVCLKCHRSGNDGVGNTF